MASPIGTPISAAQIGIDQSGLGTPLMDILMAENIQPGNDVSYQLCKIIYAYHPLGAKLVDSPIKMAQVRPREILVADAPEMVADKFNEEWSELKADTLIKQTARTARMYGIASLVIGVDKKAYPTEEPIDPKKLATLPLFFNVADPLNTAGSLVLNQLPNAPDYQKAVDVVIQGERYHRSRCCIIMNEEPIYIEYSTSAFGFVGRSVYQRTLFPLKTFIQTMFTDDMISRKAGLLIAKMKSPGSIVDRVMLTLLGIKRALLRQGQTGNVLSIGVDEDITTLNMQNIDGAAGFARTNVLKNIATGADMPAILVENETLVHGFGEGSEDAKAIVGYIDGIRAWMEPLYGFMTGIVQRRAWNDEFIDLVKRRYPERYRGMSHDEIYYEWESAFKAKWPSLLREPESEQVKVDDVRQKALIAHAQVLLPIVDPENKVNIVEWLEANIAQAKLLFPKPLKIDSDALRKYTSPEQAMASDQDVEPKQPRPFAAAA